MDFRKELVMGQHMSQSKAFYKEHGEELKAFFRRAQIYGYGNPKATVEKAEDGASVIRYQEGDWSYKDTWYGGEPYSGMSVISLNGKPCWSMVYWGRIMPIPNLNQQPVLNCLTEALQKSPPDRPWRGPTKYTAADGKHYRNSSNGGIRRFSGTERITSANSRDILYEAHYMGGIINTD